ncbi:MAG TPA: hypothetical protein VN848_13230 [Gemmatimonadales bacterium]|nr:hypothetical protein [Gemmatimonadales bacterium]
MAEPTQPIEADAHLVERIARGDRSALAELALRHGKTVYAVAYSVLFDPEAADEAVRATFREVRRSARFFDAKRRSVQRWIVELVRRIATGRVFPEAQPSGRPHQAMQLRMLEPQPGCAEASAARSSPSGSRA